MSKGIQRVITAAEAGPTSDWRRQRAFDLGDLAVSDRIENELAQLLDLACLDREELRTAVRDQRFPIQIALSLYAYQGIHGGERVAGGEVEDCHALLYVGVQEAVEALQILSRAQGNAEEIQLHRLRVKVTDAVVIARIEGGEVALVCCSIHRVMGLRVRIVSGPLGN